ncbi:MAG: glycosyltransferase [Myxococcales bacterium]|nr:glycosyltransferase [Myxococcales bacterium]
MRVVHIVQSLQLGGQERLVLELCRCLGRRGYDLAVLCLTPGGALRDEFAPIPVLDGSRRQGPDRMLPVRLARMLRRLRPEVVHTHNPAALIYGVTAARMAGVRSVVHTKHGRNRYSARSLPVVRMMVRTVSAFVCVSPETAQVAREQERVPEWLLHVVPNGIPLQRFAADPEARRRVRAELGVAEQAFVVGSVGRLSREKDYPLLLRAMRPLLGPDCHLVLVGDGPDRPRIEAAVDPQVRSFVHLCGVRHDVPALLCAFDVFALTSYTEGLPLVIPEAMASGLPIVATAVGGVPGIVPEAVGVLCPHGDLEGLTAALRGLRDEPERRARMAAAACAYARQRFSLDTMADRYAALYQLHEDRATVLWRLGSGLSSLLGAG